MNASEFFVNGKKFQFKPGETILTAVRRHLGSKFIPTLCDAPHLKPYGSCRLCVVDACAVEGAPSKVVASCHTPVTEGMAVTTHSDRIQRLRKNILELVATNHPLNCLECKSMTNCELKEVAEQVGTHPVRYPNGANHFQTPKDQSHVYMTSDLASCIHCFRCIRACDEIQGQFVLSMYGRGFDSRVIKGFDQNFKESDCVSCGACALACPTSAISDVFDSKNVSEAKEVRSTCTYCGVGCNLLVAVKDEKVKSIRAPFDSEVNPGHTCVKGRFAFNFYNHPDRLKSPMIRKSGVLTEVSWDEAFDFIASRLKNLVSKFGPDSIAGISSARCTNEENYLMQKFIRVVVGTNNIDGCARVCHSPTALGMQRTFGTGAATNSIEDLKFTDCILAIGTNATEGHPVTGAKIKQAAIQGKKLIVLDPRRTELAKFATLHLQLRPGTNVAVLNMILYFIVKEQLQDSEFIATRCLGFEEFKKKILKIDLEYLEKVSGVTKEQAKEAAIIYASADNAMSFHGLGVTEHMQGTFAVMLIAQLAMITGNIGRRGVGVNPLRGQNNVQGSADMGVQPHQGAGYLDITVPDHQAHYEKHYGRSVPKEVGLKIPEMFEAAIEGKLKALWILGEDVAQTDPNTTKVLKALESLDLLVVQELFMTETAKRADVVLPGASFLEKSGTFTNGERRIQKVNQAVSPIGQAKADGQIIVEMMNKMGFEQPKYCPEELLKEISKVVPFFAGVTWEGLGEFGRQWPVGTDGQSTPILHIGEFKIGKAPFFFIDFQESAELEENSKKYPLILTTVRDLAHYNCGTMTRRTGNVEITTKDLLLIHRSDAKKRGITNGQVVAVTSARGEVQLEVQVSDTVMPGVLSTTFHFPEMNINFVTGDGADTEALCPEYKVVAVEVRPIS